jgi:hypothetical protein
MFGTEQVGGRVPTLAVLAASDQGHGVAGGQDPVSEVLEVPVVDRQPDGDGLA